MTPHNQEMQYHFERKTEDNPNQSSCRNNYQNMLWGTINQLPDGPEKSVAKRKLLESLDAALRCHAY
jgi:hypothetical protein